MQSIILATSNIGKIKELKSLLAPMQCLPQSDFNISDVEETGLTFVENALLKARHACQFTQKPTLADDSGLVVPALNGEPGIYSARFAGPKKQVADNIALLVTKIKDIPINQRQAYFYSAIVIMRHQDDPTPLIACGQISGEIIENPIGEHGFGYDPVFYLADYQCTMAQLPAEIKNTISHRAQALKILQQQLINL